LIFLEIAPDDPRAGRMRAVLVQALDGVGMTDVADREAAALGGPRPDPELPETTVLRADTLMNLAWAHLSLGQRIDRRIPAERPQAIARLLRAADYYRLYVEQFPDGASAPSARTQLGNSLLGAGRFVDAAREFEALAENVPSRRFEGTLRALESYERALALEVDSGRLHLPSEPPPPSQRPPWTEPPAFPEPLARLFEARERFLDRGALDEDPAFARAQRLENALWLYRYARFDEAAPRLTQVIAGRCDDSLAEEAFVALSVVRAAEAGERPRAACDVVVGRSLTDSGR
jgi:hypothetical protein